MKNNRLLIILLSIIAVFAFSFSVGCGKKPDNPDNGETETQASLYLNANAVTLEKREEYLLVATFDDEEVTGVAWSSTNTAVASITNGKISAVGQGSAIIVATYQENEARCIVQVTDHGLTLGINTNIALEDKLYMITDDTFALDYSVTYNNKVLSDAEVSLNLVENEFVSMQNGVLTANKKGDATLTISASWRGLNYSFPVEIKVLDNAFAQLHSENSITLYNDVRGGEQETTFAPKFFEEEVELEYGSGYVIESWEYNDKVVKISPDTLNVTAEGKGTTDVKATFKSVATGVTVESVVTVTVELYDVDKTEDVTLDSVYLNREDYYLDINEVFDDVTSDKLEGLEIDKITDVTSGVTFDVPVADGMVDIEEVSKLGLLGNRRWQIECPKYSYVVKVSIIEVDPAKYILGTYFSQTWKYTMKILYVKNDVVAEFYDIADLQTKVDSGVVTTTVYAKTADGSNKPLTYDYNGGYFKINGLTTRKVSLPDYPIKGHYAYSSGSLKVGLALDNNDTPSVELYREDIVAQYDMIAGRFEDSINWGGAIVLNEDKTCTFKTPAIAQAINGTYELTPKTPFTGDIKITLESAYNNQTEIVGDYYYSKGGAKINVTVGTSLKNLKTENYKSGYENYSGYYTGGWVRIKLYEDGTFVFDFPYWASGWASLGTYELNDDGTINITLIRDYNYNNGFEGTYYVDSQSGKRKITLTDVKGPTQTTQTYTQYLG